ncbi:hypothetical protein [Halosimplex halophilum]|uniref:hypothetical protein n=1 Tax=Halosimplex halophilum TaxID=2559572 RepID=UPI001AE6B516|nr:hypothetical protein [Halosimplex halophilum]
MTAILTLSYVVHVVSAALWTGSVLYAAYAVLPAADAGHLGAEAFGATVDGVLQVTRWTGVALPLTGAYQVWVLYPLDALVATGRGHLVVGMAALWGLMNGVIELGVYRLRAGGTIGLVRHFVVPFGSDEVTDVSRAADQFRPYLRASAALAALLLVDAALLAAGVPG